MCGSILKRSLMPTRDEIDTVYILRKKKQPYGEARIKTCNPKTHDNAYFHMSFAMLFLPLLLFTLSSVGWLFQDALAQISLLPGDSTRGLSSSTGDDQSTSVVANETSGLNTYTNAQYGFQMDFPSNWEVLPKSSLSSPQMEGIPNTVVSLRSPAEGGIHDLVTISVQTPSQYLDTDEMVVKTSNLSPQEHARIVTDLLPEHGFKLVREKAVTVSGLPAWRIEYTTYNYETEVFVVKGDGTMYKIEFGTPMLKAPESLPVFDKMIESFRFVNASEIPQSQATQGISSAFKDSENDTGTGITSLATILPSFEPITAQNEGITDTNNEQENEDDGTEKSSDDGGDDDSDDRDDDN